MSYLDKIKVAAKAAMKGHKRVRNRELINPHRDWGIGLLASILLFVLVSAWSTQLYLGYRNTALEVPTVSNNGAIVYRQTQVAAALEYFATERTQFSTTDAAIFDESLSVPSDTDDAAPSPTTLTESDYLNDLLATSTPATLEEVATGTDTEIQSSDVESTDLPLAPLTPIAEPSL